ncbi:MAG: hypothetical protein PVI27_12850, partial [Desulfobacteraceae bacterium]
MREHTLPERQDARHAGIFNPETISNMEPAAQNFHCPQFEIHGGRRRQLLGQNRRQGVPIMPKRLEQLDVQGVYVQIFPEAFFVVALGGRHEAISEIDAQHLQPAGYGTRSAAVHSQDNDDFFLAAVFHRLYFFSTA